MISDLMMSLYLLYNVFIGLTLIEFLMTRFFLSVTNIFNN